MRKIFRSIHLCLAFIAGVFIFISCATGIILIFQNEIENATHHHRYFVKVEMVKLSLSKLIESIKTVIPGNKVRGVKVYREKDKTVEFNLEGSDKIRKMAYVNPFTGEVVDVVDLKKTFFYKVEMLHRRLLSDKGGLGDHVIGVSTFGFFFILITGIILWWPKTIKILQQRVRVKWRSGWERLNSDLHIAIGFYTSVFLIIVVLTGLIMKYDWMNKSLFALTGSKIEKHKRPKSNYHEGQSVIHLDEINQRISDKFNGIEFYTIILPKDSLDVIAVNFHLSEVSESTYFFDQYNGNEIGKLLAEDRNAGQRISAYLKPVHIGTLWGIPTKVFSFIICLAALTFPVTGLVKWRHRTMKRKKENALPNVAYRHEIEAALVENNSDDNKY